MTVIIEIEEGWLAYDKSLEFWSGAGDREIRTDRDEIAKPTNKRGWFLCPHRPNTLWYPKKVSEYTGWAVLQDGYAPSEKMPERIDTNSAGFDWEDYPTDAYRHETQEKPDERVEIDFVNCRVIAPEDGRDLPHLPEGARWVPSWKVDMLESAEVHAWLTGSLIGFRSVFARWLGQQPGVVPRMYDKLNPNPTGKWEVDLRLLWSDGRTVKEKQRGRRKPVERPTWITHRVDLTDVPDGVQGRSQWEAAEKWNALMVKWQNEIDAIGARACAHCEGKGYLVSGGA